MKKVLLYSGGTDSWLISKLENPDVKLFFDIGTESCKGEIKKLSDDVIIDKSLSGLSVLEKDDGSFIVPLRNMFFLARAAEYGEHLILGTNKTDAHNDKTYDFAHLMENLLNYYYGPSEDGLTIDKDIYVDFSYKEYTKPDLVKKYLDNGGSVKEYLEESFSCYTPTEEYEECHNCKPCFNKMMALYIANGTKDMPEGYLESFIPYLEKILENGHRYYDLDYIENILNEAKRGIKNESSLSR